MKLGLSTYSLSKAIKAGEMDVIQAIEWIAENGGECVEIVPVGFELTGNPELVGKIVERTGELGLDIASYTIGANFVVDTEEERRAEIERIKGEVEIGHALGVKFMRHDAGSRPGEQATLANFEKDLPPVVEACREIADHAAQYGITTSVENHGRHFQGSERVQRLVLAVDRPNFRTTLDVGNFICVDEDCVSAVMNNIPFASMIHMKDFYVRGRNPGEGWGVTNHGRFTRGSIVGFGDLDIPKIVQIIKSSGYDDYVSVEFEGMEDCRLGSKIGMDNTRRLWERQP